MNEIMQASNQIFELGIKIQDRYWDVRGIAFNAVLKTPQMFFQYRGNEKMYLVFDSDTWSRSCFSYADGKADFYTRQKFTLKNTEVFLKSSAEMLELLKFVYNPCCSEVVKLILNDELSWRYVIVNNNAFWSTRRGGHPDCPSCGKTLPRFHLMSSCENYSNNERFTALSKYV